MSGVNSDQLFRSTLGIYSNLSDEFNPSLQRLVLLGNSFVQAFKALIVTSEDYFSALSKIGEKAFYTVSSKSLGDVLIHISESQRRLTLELEAVFHQFSLEVLKQMDNNVRLDKDYISSSRVQYEMVVQKHASAMGRNSRRGTSQDSSEYVQFLRESYGEALKEEERRYRFLAEKHCGLIQSVARLMNKTGGTLQQKADAWTEEINATRRSQIRQPASLDNTVGIREEEFRRNREEVPLGNIPSRAPSPQGSISRFSVDSVGVGSRGKSVRAKLAHQPADSNPTLLPFNRGQIITVLDPRARNGWLYGRADSSSRPGWFPASFVEAVDDPPGSPSTRHSTLRSSSSMSSLLDQPAKSSQAVAPPPPPPPPPPQSLSSSKPSENRSVAKTADKRTESYSENPQKSKAHGRPELFPRGTNPFATVKLKPTTTNDRSAPRLHRR
ncbi:brain-specific angiogenesis inhibitor 1-associated protein 2-like protein 2 [Melanotaenia boesemani]|uniref:brain-specific angiogenesis inhibitor 1-associated protein 2-like protein 2 n=1 Tax=Melanotaenia boesemani TaxID=1250792 RepID=UPI001C047F77|nr:brain-specific angiogenesis inhibitor 1-associated protein 2-like protein 2 [Melanotaenia boesemani]